MSKASKPKENPNPNPAENENVTAPAPKEAKNKNGNKEFEEWHGRIEILRDEEEGFITGRNFVPQEKKRKCIKITQREADNINKAAANTEHYQKVVMYTEPGLIESGIAIDVNKIAVKAFRAPKPRYNG